MSSADTNVRPPASIQPRSVEPTQKGAAFGSARGVESLFRNTYRAQLDLIALAATKANIMISLNGVLVSMLLLSGAYVPRTDPWLLAPIAVLLLGCTVAITFAVLAARPERRGVSDDGDDRQEVLIFQRFARMPRASFLLAMADVLRDSDRVYTSMTVQIHELGISADRKFRMLHISYTAFVIGLIAAVAMGLTVIGIEAVIVITEQAPA